MKRRSTTPEPVVEDVPAKAGGKGRPTPKRRDIVGARGPVTAPKTRKEAYARQKELAKRQRSAAKVSRANMTPAQRRAAMRSGEILARRDQGETRRLARDYVDSHRLFSNYLLVLFPLMVLSYAAPKSWGWLVQVIVLAVFLALLVEWYLVGRRIRSLALERHGEAQGGSLSIGFYAGSRAYLPRRWRLPAPQRELGDEF
ncbi:MAG: DUF3043 domain-containing protein [Jatrophihabitans sp.]|nr:MAG: DUF3043 domain-containing protein [Jatrophihabitans sp.]